ncbi:hypothetical protein ES319_D04G107800v1, partial [Gossypium barbadense]
MGDLNAIISPNDKKSIYAIGKRCNLFCNFMDSCNLQDLGFTGPSFTWQRAGKSERLDRALANDPWNLAFPQCLVSHLPRVKSDHRPIHLRTKPGISLATGRPFRFLVGWMKHANFSSFVKDKWKFSSNMASSISDFTSHIKESNKFVYGFI